MLISLYLVLKINLGINTELISMNVRALRAAVSLHVRSKENLRKLKRREPQDSKYIGKDNIFSHLSSWCVGRGPLWWALLSAETNCSSWERPRSDRNLPLHQSRHLSQWRSLRPARGHTNQETQAVPLQVLINALVLDSFAIQQHKDKHMPAVF